MSARALFALALALTPAAAGQTPPEWSAVSMALMMRSCTAQACVHTYERDLRPSLLAFFPWRAVPLVVVLDHDDPENEAARLPERFSARAPFAQVRFSWTEAGTDAAVWGHRGHERQQYTQYFADYYTDAELVGFVDSDTLFITPVTRGDLFDERLRPRIIGQVGRPADDVYWDAVPAITQGMLKLESVCRGMAYFPVLLRTAHLAALRAHIARVHGRPFAEVFREHCAARRQCSCYDVMLTYVWTFHRNDYAWHFQQYDPFWLPSTVRGQVANFSFLTPANTQPTVRVAVHVGQLGNYFFGAAASRWQDARFPPVGAAEVTVCVQRQVLWGWCSVVSWLHLAAGGSGGGGEEDDGKAGAGGVHSSWIAACDVLFGGEDGERQRQAQSVHALARVEGRGAVVPWRDTRDVPEEHAALFRFEGSDWRWDPRCLDAEEAHYRRIRASVASHGWAWGGGGRADEVGDAHADDALLGLLFDWAERLREGDVMLPAAGTSHECHCHLAWPLEKFRFHGGGVAARPAASSTWCVDAPAFVDAMKTSLVLGARGLDVREAGGGVVDAVC